MAVTQGVARGKLLPQLLVSIRQLFDVCPDDVLEHVTHRTSVERARLMSHVVEDVVPSGEYSLVVRTLSPRPGTEVQANEGSQHLVEQATFLEGVIQVIVVAVTQIRREINVSFQDALKGLLVKMKPKHVRAHVQHSIEKISTF
jgi:hypothetical protein